MATITFQGKPVQTVGDLPKVGTQAPTFTLTKTDLSEFTLKECLGKKIILNIFPSLDTSTCAKATRQFNHMANKLPNVVVLSISADLPFAQKRFCDAEQLTHVIPVSVFRHLEFGKKYGVTITEGLFAGLLSRAVVLIDEYGKIKYTEQVRELSAEPNYQGIIDALKN